MDNQYAYNEIFDSINDFDFVEYEQCSFNNCAWQNGNLARISFVDCSFNNCDLTMANVSQTALKGVQFNNCKVLGVQFQYINPFLFEATFNHCILNLSSFFELNMHNSKFIHCQMHEVDFVSAHAAKITFDNCDLLHAVFDNTNLEQADFKTATNFSINPLKNKLKKAKFSTQNLTGLLDSFNLSIS